MYIGTTSKAEGMQKEKEQAANSGGGGQYVPHLESLKVNEQLHCHKYREKYIGPSRRVS
jgi:hypothetical protein